MNLISSRRLLSAVALLAVLAGCGGGSSNSSNTNVTDPNAQARQANATNFSRTYFIGDSLTAGFQNGSLFDDPSNQFGLGQTGGYANLIAKQAGFPIVLPLIALPGAPNELTLVNPNTFPPTIVPRSGQTTGREVQQIQATDLAVPGHKLQDAISTRPSATPAAGQQQLDTLVLGIPGLALNISRSQLEWVENLDPTQVFVWIGNNDALIADITGMPSSMTPISQFTVDYTLLTNRLLQNTKGHLIMANIPDVTLVPYLTPGAVVLAVGSQQSGIPPQQLSAILGIAPNDLVNPNGISQALAILQKKQAPPISDAGFLSAAEVAQVQAQVNAYNQVIAQQAQRANATLIDIHALFAAVASGTVVVNGRPVTNHFLGNAFSLDGIHPTNTGYALLANFFIDNINAQLKTSIPDVNVSAVATNDPLFHSQVVVGNLAFPTPQPQVDAILNH